MTMKRVFKITSITLVLLFVSVWGLLFFLPAPPLLSDVSFSSAIYDHQHRLLRLTLSEDDKYRVYTPLEKMSPKLISATLLQEDQYFWHHYGVNPIALFRAVWESYVMRSHRVGASTLTMQVARLRLGIHSKSISGKIVQIMRALQLEMHYSKKQILETYLNLAPYGNNIEGVGAASLIYFNQKVSEISLPQALTLSIIPQNPNKRTPHNSHLKDVRNKLFIRWVKEHPEDIKQQAIIELPLVMRNLQDLPFIAPHFVNHLLHDYPSKHHETITTLDVHTQALLARITKNYINRKKSLGAHNAAILLVDVRDMGVKALIGSVDFFRKSINGQINGTEIKRSPGSTLKPFIYALALDQGLIHPHTVLKDVPHSFGNYNPENFDYDFMGPIKAKDALVLSRNIPAIDLASQLANPNLYQLLEAAQVRHLKPESYYGLALTLGGAELSMQELIGLYAMLANDGVWHPLRMDEHESVALGRRLLSSEASFLVLDILKETQRSGLSVLPVHADSLPVSWKTGTSSGYRDAWSVGIFGPYVLAVWIGNFDNTGNPAFIGKNIAAPLFFELIDAVKHEQGPLSSSLKSPETLNLQKVDVCKISGMLPTRFCHDTESTWFIPGKSPIRTDTIYREVAIDNKTGLRVCHFDENTRFEIYEFWPTDLLKIFKQAGIQRRSPPAYTPGCSLVSNRGLSPQITSPQLGLSYILPANAKQKTVIPLTAVTDGDTANIYWFINGAYLGKTRAAEPLLWIAKTGKHVIRVVDDHGLSDARDVVIQMNG